MGIISFPGGAAQLVLGTAVPIKHLEKPFRAERKQSVRHDVSGGAEPAVVQAVKSGLERQQMKTMQPHHSVWRQQAGLVTSLGPREPWVQDPQSVTS